MGTLRSEREGVPGPRLCKEGRRRVEVFAKKEGCGHDARGRKKGTEFAREGGKIAAALLHCRCRCALCRCYHSAAAARRKHAHRCGATHAAKHHGDA